MNIVKTITKMAAVVTASAMLSTTAFADYELGNLKQFYSFEDYSSPYAGGSNTEPDGFVNTSSSWKGVKGYGIDETRQSKTYKLNDYALETVLKFGTIVDSGMLHISYDLYQDYNDANPYSKAKNLSMMLSRTSGGYYSEGWYHGAYTNKETYYDQYDPEAITFNADSYQHIMDIGGIEEWEGNETEPIPTKKSPIFYYNEAKHWGTTPAYDPDKRLDWRQWYKIDIFFNKDDNTYKMYFNGDVVEGHIYANGKFGDILPATLNASPIYKATKGVVFRVHTATMFPTGTRPNLWHRSNGGTFMLDNVYVKNYTGENDIISINTDDKSGNGVKLTGGTLNVAYSEYMGSAADKSNVEIKNVFTGEAVTDFEISNSDNMQFVINFGDTQLSPGEYEIKVTGVRGKISGEEVALPAYFNTVAQDSAWVKNFKCFRNSGAEQERGRTVTSGTTAVSVEFSEPMNVSAEEAADYFEIESAGKMIPVDKCEISEDKKTIKVYPQYLFNPGSESAVRVKGGMPTVSGNPMITNTNGYSMEEAISVANDPVCEYSRNFELDDENSTAKLAVDVVKSDESIVKYTAVVAAYKDVEDENGNIVPKMLDVKYVPISIDADQRVLKKYITDTVDCAGADRVKAFIWEYPSFNNVYTYEQEL